MEMVSLTLLRHGRSRADDENVFESRYDSDLSEVGRSQIENLARQWALDTSRGYDLIVASPLKRAKSAAAILAALYKVPVVEEPLLNEIDAGHLSGMDKAEGMRKYPPPTFSGPYDRIVGGSGESEAQLHSRALSAVESILNKKKQRYLLVSHGMLLNAIVRVMFSIPMPVNRDGVSFRFTDGGYLDLQYDETSHRWTVLRFIGA
jgi:2,3-bisphosphoglycerate-dependent phosphoglycerate mutase